METNQYCYSSSDKRRRRHPFCFRKFLVLFWLLGLILGSITRRNDPVPSGRSQAGSSLFVSAAVEAKPADDSSSGSASAFLLLCLTDGSIYSVEAWTGAYQSSIATDPLLQTHRAAASTDIVLPGLDGRLYWRPPPHPKDDEGGTVVPQPWQELPLTVTALLENPVRSCDPSDESNNAMMECGILTAQAVTSLLALTETGELLWRTGPDESSRPRNNNNDNNILLLQRKDYWVQHVLASTGQQSWNVSLGTYQALDFGLPDDDDDIVRDKAAAADPSIRWLDDDDIPDEPPQQQSPQLLLPAVVFSDQGRTVTAVDPRSQRILWRQHVPSTLSAVFGIAQGQWKTVPVLTVTGSDDDDENDEEYWGGQKSSSSSPYLPALRHPEYDGGEQQDFERFLWMQQQQRWSGHQQQQHYLQQQIPARQALPSPRREEDPVCWINGQRVEGGTCPNLYQQQPLRLPAPSVAAVQAGTEGLLLSWSLVSFLVVLLVVTLACVRFWYVRKKAKWMTMMTAAKDAEEEDDESNRRERRRRSSSITTARKNSNALLVSSSSSGGDRSVGALTRRRSNSLPGVLGTPDPLQLQQLPNNDNKMAKSDDGTTATTVQGVVDTVGTIPLVRYSRYASEFIELRALGRGGFGSVFQCQNALDGRDYAVKKVSIRSGGGGDVFQQQLQRVLREVKILAVLDHPNIVRYYTAWLEIDGDASSTNNSHTNNTTTPSRTTAHDNTEMGDLSRCYSSSLLLDSDSVSGWDVAPPAANQTTTYAAQHYNPLSGWENTGFDVSPSSSQDSSPFRMPRRRSLKHSSCGDLMIFEEDSNEEKEDSSASGGCQPPTSRSGTQQSSPLESNGSLRRRSQSLGNQSDTLFDRKSTTAAAADSSVPATTTTQGTGLNASMRHTLYIQMQLCSQKTVAEYLADAQTRRGPDSTTDGVDIPKALRLFLQIAEAVKHVHQQGLIHRDLKPSNCFMDDLGSTVKVGDFGLSRESTMSDATDEVAVGNPSSTMDAGCCNEDHTAGVGTRSYASPEQMNGSDYDSSTDVFSLGIMLFELLYPMYTGMERNICLSGLRHQKFPDDWEKTVGKAFPTMTTLIIAMLSESPADRPTADSVARHIQSILGEFTILSLDTQHYKDNSPDVILLRVEAEHRDDALRHTMQLIRDESTAAHGSCPVDIVQYGLRSASSSTSTGKHDEPAAAIMEFALRYKSMPENSGEGSTPYSSAAQLVTKLTAYPEIYKARQVSGGTSSTQS